MLGWFKKAFGKKPVALPEEQPEQVEAVVADQAVVVPAPEAIAPEEPQATVRQADSVCEEALEPETEEPVREELLPDDTVPEQDSAAEAVTASIDLEEEAQAEQDVELSIPELAAPQLPAHSEPTGN